MNGRVFVVSDPADNEMLCCPSAQGGIMMYASVLLIAVMVADTPQMLTVVPGTRVVGKPVPTKCSPNPPLVPPEVTFKLARVSGKLNGTTAGARATIPTWVTVTTGV